MKDNNVIKYLQCPLCGDKMTVSNDEKRLYCLGQRVHSFDFSTKGYVNFAINKGITGDSKEAVRSRSDFLNKGYYKPVCDSLCEILQKYKSNGFLIDAGCGEGYYTKRMAELGYSVLGIDLSKFAINSTASRLQVKNNNNSFACVGSIFKMPVGDASVDAIVSVFAPCSEKEMARVLADDGVMIVVSAGREHLMGLKKVLYDNPYENDDRADMPMGMELIEQSSISYCVTLESNEDILNLFSMTPYYWRTSQNDRDKLLELETLTTSVDIIFSVYKKVK